MTSTATSSRAMPVPRITGSTAVFLIAGDPVLQVRAPEVFNRVFAHLGIDAVLVPAHVGPSDLAAFVRGAFLARNVRGFFLAIPHKAPMVGLLDICSLEGQVAGAVNGVRRNADGALEGGLFDGAGFLGALQHYGMAWTGRQVLVLGAGGGASAIGAALADDRTGRGAARVALYDPVPGKAAEVAGRIRAAFGADVVDVPSADPAGYDLVVNASPLGLDIRDPVPCDVDRIDAGTALVDILMKNQPTPLVRAARARGLQAEPGFEMLIQQTPHYLDFFGYPEAADAVRRDARFLRELIYPAELAGEIDRPRVAAAAIA